MSLPGRRDQSGFTYLWVLLTVALVGLGLSLAADVYTTSLQREKERELLAIGAQFRAAIASYYALGLASRRASPVDAYPTSLEDLLEDKRLPGLRRHLRKIFVDPMTGRNEWGLVKIGDRIVGVHSLSDRMPIQQANFDPDDVALNASSKLSDWWFTYPADIRIRINGAGQLAMPIAAPLPMPSPPAASSARSIK